MKYNVFSDLCLFYNFKTVQASTDLDTQLVQLKQCESKAIMLVT